MPVSWDTPRASGGLGKVVRFPEQESGQGAHRISWTQFVGAMASVHESLYFNPMMTNGVVHANVFGIKDWVTPYKIAVLVLLNEMGRTGEGAVSLMERRRLNQLLLPLLQVRVSGSSSKPLLCTGSVTGQLPGGCGHGGLSDTLSTLLDREKYSYYHRLTVLTVDQALDIQFFGQVYI